MQDAPTTLSRSPPIPSHTLSSPYFFLSPDSSLFPFVFPSFKPLSVSLCLSLSLSVSLCLSLSLSHDVFLAGSQAQSLIELSGMLQGALVSLRDGMSDEIDKYKKVCGV